MTTAARPANDSALRRALRRARDGAALDTTEAATLLQARGDQLGDLCRSAGRVRDQGLLDAGRPGIITYSRKVFIPLTRLCRDRCHYCTFATTPGQVPRRLPGTGRGGGDRPGRRRRRVQGSPVHPRRPTGGPLGGSPGMA